MIEVYPSIVTQLSRSGDVVGTTFSVIATDEYETHNLGSFESVEEMLSVVSAPRIALQFLEDNGASEMAYAANKHGFKLCGEWLDLAESEE